ncbi:MAG: DUF4190 domain-containing protein [Ruminococcus sp.]
MDENYNNQNNDYSNNQNPYNSQPQNGYQNNYNYNQQNGYQNGYNQPQQYYQEPADNSKGLAIASLVLGIVSFFCCGSVCSIVGLVLGIMSRKKNPVNNGMATAGIVLSIIALVLWLVVVIWSFAVTGSMIGIIEDIARDGNVHYSYSF